jgi:hypothetical protein
MAMWCLLSHALKRQIYSTKNYYKKFEDAIHSYCFTTCSKKALTKNEIKMFEPLAKIKFGVFIPWFLTLFNPCPIL